MTSQRTFLIALLVVCIIGMIHAGIGQDIGDALHYDDVKNFTKNAAEKVGEAAAGAVENAKDFVKPK